MKLDENSLDRDDTFKTYGDTFLVVDPSMLKSASLSVIVCLFS
jgi:hypothetical protein